MKKICLIVFCMCFVSSLFGQEPIKSQPKQKIKYDFKYYETRNEIQTNMFLNILRIANISYERIINETMSINTFLGFSIVDNVPIKFILYPKIKIYSRGGICDGWFIDLGLILLNSKYNYTKYEESGLGIGLDFGYKFINSKNWFFELGFGITKTSLDIYEDRMFDMIMITISGGKRF